jgi:hypothetical protein
MGLLDGTKRYRDSTDVDDHSSIIKKEDQISVLGNVATLSINRLSTNSSGSSVSTSSNPLSINSLWSMSNALSSDLSCSSASVENNETQIDPNIVIAPLDGLKYYIMPILLRLSMVCGL